MDLELKGKLELYQKKGLFRRSGREKDLAAKHLGKARNNLIAMQIDFRISSEERIQKLLGISGFAEYDWVIIKGYYAMYHAALACLAKLALRSENHDATSLALELYFVRSGRLEAKYIRGFERAKLEMDYIEKLRNAKRERVIAQYDVSADVEQRASRWILKVSMDFVDRLEKLFCELA